MQKKIETPSLSSVALERREPLSIETRQSIYGLIVVLMITVIGMALTLQGWRSHIPASDMLTYFNSAENLIKTGTPASYGDISSYGSFSPPGTTWLLAPGMLLLNDPRLYEKLGSGLLYLGTLLGVFQLARTVFDNWCAILSVVLYGLSGLGLAFAGSLWPIGHPFFYVWMAYLSIEWVVHRDFKYLAAAILIWTFGMYDDMAITPAALIFPALGFIYRPPLFTRYHFLVAILTVALWYPYLQFEAGREFSDLRSLFLRQQILPTNYKDAWCDPNLTFKPAEIFSGASLSGTFQETPKNEPNFWDRLLKRASIIMDGLLANFQENTRFLATSVILLLLMLSSVVTLNLFVWFRRGSIISNCIQAIGELNRTKIGAFLLSLGVPWLLLLIVAEQGRPERFFWLWPLQVIALAALVTFVSVRLHTPQLVQLLGQAVLIGVILIPVSQSHLTLWLKDGWAGSDPEEVRVVDYLANQIQSEAKEQASIGYAIFIYEFMPQYAILDRGYKVGSEFDFMLRQRHRITNNDQCAEGISSNDEYRIVQTRRIGDESAPSELFDLPLDSRFHLMQSFELYQVFKRD